MTNIPAADVEFDDNAVAAIRAVAKFLRVSLPEQTLRSSDWQLVDAHARQSFADELSLHPRGVVYGFVEMLRTDLDEELAIEVFAPHDHSEITVEEALVLLRIQNGWTNVENGENVTLNLDYVLGKGLTNELLVARWRSGSTSFEIAHES
jgi:hypothetical protein